MRNKVIALRKKDNWFHENFICPPVERVAHILERLGGSQDHTTAKFKFLGACFCFAAGKLIEIFDADSFLGSQAYKHAANLDESIANVINKKAVK